MTFLAARYLGHAALFGLAGGLAVFACSSSTPDDGLGATKPPTRPIDDDDTADDDDDDGSTSGTLPSGVDAGKLAISRITAGAQHTCVLWNDGILKCWGRNDQGQLGVGDTTHRGDAADTMGKKLPPVNVGNGARTEVVGAGGARTCAILVGGAVKCWGLNILGGLGQPDDDNRGISAETMGDDLPPVDLGDGVLAKDLGQGDFATCALLTNGTVKCWGSNIGGELGYGDSYQRGGTGEDSRPLGNDLPPIDIGLSDIVSVRLTNGTLYQTGCALAQNGTMKCWGGNDRGQLGIGDVNDNRGDNNDEMGGQLPLTPVGGKVKFLAPGYESVCVGLDNDLVRCWGSGDFGKLGQGNADPQGTDAGVNLPLVNLGTSSKLVGGSMYDHTCIVFEDRTVKCWGKNDAGQLGLGDTQNRGDAPGQMGTSLPTVDFGVDTPLEVATGMQHTCVRFATNKVKCWGDNTYGQLGYGDVTARGATAATMGAALPYLDLGR